MKNKTKLRIAIILIILLLLLNLLFDLPEPKSNQEIVLETDCSIQKCEFMPNNAADYSGEMIRLRTNYTLKEIDYLYYHELGHHIYYKIISDKDKTKWLSLDIEKRVTKNAYKSDSEHFADTFAYWANGWLDLEPQQNFFKEIMSKYYTLQTCEERSDVDN